MVGSSIGFSQSVLKVDPQSQRDFIQHRIGMNTGIRSMLHQTPKKVKVKKPPKKSK